MASGPRHYRDAERLLEQAYRCTGEKDVALMQAYATAAVGHGLLALAAATALADAGAEAGMPLPDYNEWITAASLYLKD